MVRRLLALAVVLATGLVAPSGASATNTRVSIANYAWSTPAVQIDLGEKVTWDWLGPDLAHSVTGISANDLGWDSDPGTDAPSHRAGDAFTLQFTQPGAFLFQCKLHASVRGEVIVSSTPGNPSSDPGPRPPLNLDVKAPTLGGIVLPKPRFRGTRGAPFSAQISERGTLDGEYYRLNKKGKRTYNGYRIWKTFIGINHLALGARWKHFKAQPGRYEVVLRATDTANNVSKPVRKRFEIVG
ncbi:MAG TPA: plastocyanin/azurin family copper-binding protein [Solirubrobacterales bacterium]|nr:plastocyanin/azurin family copper-binding protein [Solirubrobacterales bacterium]